MKKDIYRELQERLNLYSVGFPATTSGVEIRILKKLFSSDDAFVFLKMTHLLEPAKDVAGNLGMSVQEAEEKLADMASRGLLFSRKKDGQTLYGATPFVHGIFEYQVTRVDKEFAELMEEYGNEAFGDAIAGNASGFLRTIPVQESIETENRVASYDDAIEIIKSKKTIVVADCACRKVSDTIDQSCGKLMAACMLFDTMAEYYIEHNLGRQITVEEAIDIQKEGQKQGLVTQPATAQNPAGMCLCCGDCCGILRALNDQPKPAEIVNSNHYAVLERATCNGCKVCVKRCQMGALTMDIEGFALLNPDRCIGCGLCVTTCPAEALTLEVKTKKEQYTLPSDSMGQMMAIAQKRIAGNPFLLIGNTIIQMKIMYRMLRKRLGLAGR